MRRAVVLALVVACAGLGACSRPLDPKDPDDPKDPNDLPTDLPQPTTTTVSLQLQNGGAAAAYVYQGCLIDYKIASLADPSMTINRVEGCLCTCGQDACAVCGACYAGPREIAAGAQLAESWLTATVTTESGGPFGSCQRLHALPGGDYRIELPVYTSEADAAAKVLARVVTQVIRLPALNDTVTIPIGATP